MPRSCGAFLVSLTKTAGSAIDYYELDQAINSAFSREIIGMLPNVHVRYMYPLLLFAAPF